VKFIVFIFCAFLSVLTFSQSYRFIKHEDLKKKILSRTSTAASNFCNKKLVDFTQFIIVDTTFEVILVRSTIEDSIRKINFRKDLVRSKIESNLRLIERIRLNLFWYPLKKEVFEKEIAILDEEVLKLTHEIQELTAIKIKLEATENMDEIDYYKVTFIGDSKNQKGEGMFWYSTVYYEPDGQIKIVNFEP